MSTKFPLKIKKLKKISLKHGNKYDIKMLKQIVNKRNEIQQKNFRITNKEIKKGVKFQDISEKYKNLVQEGIDPRNIVITAKNKTGNWLTLKSKNYSGDTLKYDDQEENYFDSLPTEIRDELTSEYHSVDVIIY